MKKEHTFTHSNVVTTVTKDGEGCFMGEFAYQGVSDYVYGGTTQEVEMRARRAIDNMIKEQVPLVPGMSNVL